MRVKLKLLSTIELSNRRLEKMKDEPTLFGPRTFTSEIHHQNRGRYLITEVKNGKPGVVDEWTISEKIPVDYLISK